MRSSDTYPGLPESGTRTESAAIAATPVGMRGPRDAEVLKTEDGRFFFKVEARDERI